MSKIVTKMEVEKSIVTLLSDCGLFCSAFDGFIVFGYIEKKIYITKKYFLFYKCEYYLFFVFLFQIAKVVSGQSTVTQSTIIEKDDRKYSWEITQDSNIDNYKVILQSQNQNNLFKLTFNLSEIKHFALTITRLILPSLNLTFEQAEVLEIASEANVKTIEGFKTLTQRKIFLQKILSNSNHLLESCSILLLHYRDIIMLIHKLKTIATIDEEELNKILIV